MNKSLWETLGFKHSPYDCEALPAAKEGIKLLVGRKSESQQFINAISAADHGAYLVTGCQGVGKTSFVNVQQIMLETKAYSFAPKILSARIICNTQADDDQKALALRALRSLVRSYEEYCMLYRKKPTKQIQEIAEWLRRSKSEGFGIGIQILGSGGSINRNIAVPDISSVSFEAVQVILECVAVEATTHLDLAGVAIAIDNVEVLGKQKVQEILMTFRDTLFMVPRIYWILIGLDEIARYVKSEISRVGQRLIGTIQLPPLSFRELHEAVECRVDWFHAMGGGKAPLPSDIHERLYNASFGEIRFVFYYSNIICINAILNVRRKAIAQIEKAKKINEELLSGPLNKLMQIAGENIEEFEDALDLFLGSVLSYGQIKSDTAEYMLKNIITDELTELRLTLKEKEVLRTIGKNNVVRQQDYEIYGIRDEVCFAEQYLLKLRNINQLHAQEIGGELQYQLKGISALAYEYNLLN